MKKRLEKLIAFGKSNKWITLIFAIAIFYVLFITFCNDISNKWFDLLFQISLGYIASYIFYVVQVYLPDIKRYQYIDSQINKRLELIIRDLENPLKELSILANVPQKEDYNENDYVCMAYYFYCDPNAKIDTASVPKVENIKDLFLTTYEDMTIQYDLIFKYYSSRIDVELMELLDNINCDLFTGIYQIIKSGEKIYSPDFLKEYHCLAKKIKDFQIKTYSDDDNHK